MTWNQTRARQSRWPWLLALAVLLAAILFSSSLVERLPVAAWGVALGEAGTAGAFLLVLVGALATAIGLPRQMVALAAGYAFGTGSGLLLALVAALAGCSLSVLAARSWLRDPVQRRFPDGVAKLADFAAKDTFLKILILRLQPFGTNLVSNLAAGVIRLPLAPFLGASAIGYVPQTLVFVLIGSGVRVGSRTELSIAIVLLLLSVLLGWLVWRRHAQPHSRSS